MGRMTILAILLSLLSFCFAVVASASPDITPRKARPNILVIVADDMGYTDLGSFGGEINTPNIDQIASQGIRFSNFHTLPTCAPTRAVLLTGTDNHIAGLGSQLNSAKQQGKPGYEGHLNNRVITVAQILKSSGYRTYMSGKWHLGHQLSERPISRGFEETFALLPGGASHYADSIPLHPAEPVVYSRNGQDVTSLPEDFYSTRDYTDYLMSWLERDSQSQTPFFAYLAFTAPHDPLHAPAKHVEKYKGRYDQGYEQLRRQRFSGLKTAGLFPKDVPLPTWPRVIPRWDSLTVDEKVLSSRRMEVYAAMIDYMDEQIGRVYKLLKQQGQLENTLIVFMSDNGANGFSASLYPTHDNEFHAQFDNSLDNTGKSGSFTGIEAGWATASSAAFRRFKGFNSEGGIRTPAIAKMPASSSVNSINNDYTHVADWVPTFLSLAGVAHPSASNQAFAALRGTSLAPYLLGEEPDFVGSSSRGFEAHGSRAFFQNEWKAIQTLPPMGSGEWELFNLQKDPTESTNLAFENRHKLAELIAEHEAYEQEVGVVYDVIPILKPLANLLMVMQCLIVAGLLSTIAFRKTASSPLVLAYDGIKITGVFMLFTPYYFVASWALIALLVIESVVIILRSRTISKAWLPLLTSILIALVLVIKLGYLLTFML